MRIKWVLWVSNEYQVSDTHLILIWVSCVSNEYQMSIKSWVSNAYHLRIKCVSKEYHEYHLSIIWVSNEYQMRIKCVSNACQMRIRWVYCVSVEYITWVSNEYSMSINWVSDKYHAYQMRIKWVSDEYQMSIRCVSNEYQMRIRWVSWCVNGVVMRIKGWKGSFSAMALAAPAMSLPRDSIRSLPCGTGCEAVSRGMPGHSATDHFAAPAGARTDTCCTTTVAGSVQQGPTDSLTVRGPDHLGSCQPGRIYASVSQERCYRLELRESSFRPRSVGVLHGIVVIQHASLTTMSTPYLRSIRIRNNWTVSSYESKIDPQSEQLDGIELSV